MKRNFRKILALNAAMIFIFGGCNKKSETSEMRPDKNNPVNVTLWHYYNGVQQTTFDEFVKEFNETVGAQEGIKVEAVSKNTISELAQSVIATVNNEPGAEKAPDIFATYSETAYMIDSMGMLADLSKYFTDEEINEYVDGYIYEGMFSNDGSLKIFPTAKSTELMMLNYTDWEKFSQSYGVSVEQLSTWEGLCEVAEEYYQYTDELTPDIYNDGKAFFGRDSVANYMNIGAAQLGNPFIEVSKGQVKLNIDKKTVRKLWDCYYVPYVCGYYTSQNRYRSDDVKTGAIIAMVCSTTGAAYYPSEVTINDEYTYPISNIVLPVPNFEGTKPYIVQQGAGMSVIKSDEKTEYASSVFLKWFTQSERNIRFSVGSGYLPVKKSANNIEEIKRFSDGNDLSTMMSSISTAIEQISNSELYSSAPFDNSTEFRNCLENYIQQTADKKHEELCQKISVGADREQIISEYTSDTAFDEWYTEFKSTLESIVYNK